jgi:hypothetical protein
VKRLACVALAACAHQALHAMPGELARARDRVMHHERVTMATLEGEDAEVEPDHVVTLETRDGKRIPMRLDELLRDCPPSDDTLVVCGNPNVQDVVIGDRRHLNDNVASVLRGTAVLAVIIALPVCSFECSSPYNYISDGVLVVGAVAIGIGLYVLAHNFGRPMT